MCLFGPSSLPWNLVFCSFWISIPNQQKGECNEENPCGFLYSPFRTSSNLCIYLCVLSCWLPQCKFPVIVKDIKKPFILRIWRFVTLWRSRDNFAQKNLVHVCWMFGRHYILNTNLYFFIQHFETLEIIFIAYRPELVSFFQYQHQSNVRSDYSQHKKRFLDLPDKGFYWINR
jgi:hypothetical protein